jgi:7-keto-8-aminopelargonate synthetase-like enzyme
MNHKAEILNYLKMLVIAIVTSLLVSLIFASNKPREIFTVDVDAIIKESIVNIIKNNKDREKDEASIVKLHDKLHHILDSISKANKIVIIPSKSAIYGSIYGNKDITLKVKELLGAGDVN